MDQVNTRSMAATCMLLAMFRILMNKQSLSLGERLQHLMKIIWSLVLASVMVIFSYIFSWNNYWSCCALMRCYFVASTHDQDVFSFYPDGRPCNGFAEALARYREIVPQLRLAGRFCYFMWSLTTAIYWFLFYYIQLLIHNLSFLLGPTSFAPIIEMAMTIVEQSGGQYHVLLIIADGQVCVPCAKCLSFHVSYGPFFFLSFFLDISL